MQDFLFHRVILWGNTVLYQQKITEYTAELRCVDLHISNKSYKNNNTNEHIPYTEVKFKTRKKNLCHYV